MGVWDSIKSAGKYVPVIGPLFQASDQKAAYDNMMKMSTQQQGDIQNFWRGQQAHAEANYKPLQDMFASSYGTQGLQAPKLPGGR